MQLEIQKKLAVKQQRETHFLSNEEKEKWIDDVIDREPAGARKRDEDTKVVVQQEQDDMKWAKIAGLTSREPEMTFQEMVVATSAKCILVTGSVQECLKGCGV